MIERNYLRKLFSYERICDCSNHVDICEIILHEKNETNLLLFERIANKYHLNSCNVSYETEDYNFTVCTDDKYSFTECFLKYCMNHCKQEIAEHIDDLSQSWDKLQSLEYDKIKNLDISSYKTISAMLENIKNRKLKYFACAWGTNKLYIKDGFIYRCKNFAREQSRRMNINEFAYIRSVDENDTCKSCYVKYICGGICDFSFDNHKQSCELIKNVIDYVLIKYILDEPHNIVEIQ